MKFSIDCALGLSLPRMGDWDLYPMALFPHCLRVPRPRYKLVHTSIPPGWLAHIARAVAQGSREMQGVLEGGRSVSAGAVHAAVAGS